MSVTLKLFVAATKVIKTAFHTKISVKDDTEGRRVKLHYIHCCKTRNTDNRSDL